MSYLNWGICAQSDSIFFFLRKFFREVMNSNISNILFMNNINNFKDKDGARSKMIPPPHTIL